MSLVAAELHFGPETPSTVAVPTRPAVLFDTDSQTPLPYRFPSFAIASKFLAAVERSGAPLSSFNTKAEIQALFQLWNDAHKR